MKKIWLFLLLLPAIGQAQQWSPFNGETYISTGITNVTATAPLSSSGGQSPNISIASTIQPSVLPSTIAYTNIDNSWSHSQTFLSSVTVNLAIQLSSGVFAGVSISTQAAGGAGALVTVSCPNNSFALSGGCNCSGAVTPTSTVNLPYPTPTVAGNMPTGWQCQEAGGTGATCAAFVICSGIRF